MHVLRNRHENSGKKTVGQTSESRVIIAAVLWKIYVDNDDSDVRGRDVRVRINTGK